MDNLGVYIYIYQLYNEDEDEVWKQGRGKEDMPYRIGFSLVETLKRNFEI